MLVDGTVNVGLAPGRSSQERVRLERPNPYPDQK